MSVTVTHQITHHAVSVTGNPVENNVVVTVSNARGPAGGGGGSSAWGAITGTLADQSDLQSALNAKLAIATAATTYQPLAGVLTATTASFTTADETKLDGIATGATANSSDATLIARANHTGTQDVSTISGLAGGVAAALAIAPSDPGGFAVAGNDIRWFVNDNGWTSSNSGTGTSSSGSQLYASSGATSGGIGFIRMGGYAPWVTMPAGGSNAAYDFSVPFRVRFSIGCRYGSSETTYSSTGAYFVFGQIRTGVTYGPLTVKGLAIKFENGLCYGQAHNGTTLATTSSPLFSAIGNIMPVHMVEIKNHGDGNVSFYVDGEFVETIAGPLGTTAPDYTGAALMVTTSTAKTFDIFVNYPIAIIY